MLSKLNESISSGGAAMGGLPSGMSMREHLDYEIRSSLSEGIEFDLIAMGRGELGKFQGTSGARTDYLVHLFRNLELIEARYETDLSPETRALVEAFADGVNR